MPTFTIPVAFSVNAEDEGMAARALVELLTRAHLVGQHRLWRERHLIEVEDWSMPNHQYADGSDGEQMLAWVERVCDISSCDKPRDYHLHRPSSECDGCRAPLDHHEFVLKEAR